MTVRHYLAIAEPGPHNWSVSFPAFPGVVTVGGTFEKLVEHAGHALASAIEAMQEDGLAPPPDYTQDEGERYNPSDYNDPRILVIAADVASKAIRINVTMEAGLVDRLDRLAEQSHSTRSALLAKGAKLILKEPG